MKVGLTLGKFAPLHRGHQLLIETALREMDRVVVMVYGAPETHQPLPKRAGWIRALYPGVEVIEAPDGPLTVGYTPEITAVHDRYILSRLDGRRITHFYSSEPYGEHVSRALGAVDRRVDEARKRVPVSATQVRSDPWLHRRFIDPIVYRDLIVKVALLGGPSTGKTTLAAALARRHQTVWMPEYGREYWEAHQSERRLSIAQLVEIAEEHRRREDALIADARKLFFVDTDASTTRLFSLHYHGASDPRLDLLAEEAASRYDVFLLCEDDIPYSDTEDRSGEANRAMFQQWVREDLERRGLEAVSLYGTIEQRMRRADEVIASELQRSAEPE
jgi:HTH-type transcriptional regulator, transcriptional repressor of NAD biosynthesis genes